MPHYSVHHIGHLIPLTPWLWLCRPPWIPPSRLWPQRCSPWRWSTHAGTCQQSSGGALSSSACSAPRRPCWIPPVATRWVTAEGTGHAKWVLYFSGAIGRVEASCRSQTMEQLPCLLTSVLRLKLLFWVISLYVPPVLFNGLCPRHSWPRGLFWCTVMVQLLEVPHKRNSNFTQWRTRRQILVINIQHNKQGSNSRPLILNPWRILYFIETLFYFLDFLALIVSWHLRLHWIHITVLFITDGVWIPVYGGDGAVDNQ